VATDLQFAIPGSGGLDLLRVFRQRELADLDASRGTHNDFIIGLLVRVAQVRVRPLVVIASAAGARALVEFANSADPKLGREVVSFEEEVGHAVEIGLPLDPRVDRSYCKLIEDPDPNYENTREDNEARHLLGLALLI